MADEKRKRGRPRLAVKKRRVNVTLSAETIAILQSISGGNVSRAIMVLAHRYNAEVTYDE